MLYNPRWERGVTELDEIISWLETQRPGRRYGYRCEFTCLFARYARAMEVGDRLDLFARQIAVAEHSNRLYYRYQHIVRGGPRTYGAALERAREMRGW